MNDARLTRREFGKRVAGVGAALAGVRAVQAAVVAESRPATASVPVASRPAEQWRIGCSTRPWDGFDYPVAFEAIAEAGYRYVGPMTARTRTGLVIGPESTPDEIDKVRAALDRFKLRVITLYGGDINVAKSVKAGVETLRKLIEHSSAVGSESVMLGGTADAKLYEAYYKAVAKCCDFAADKRVMIVLKPHGGLNNDGPTCRKAIETVSHPNFRIWYDAGNILYYSDGKIDPVADAPAVDGLVAGWCIKDFKPPKEVFVNPGDGKVDFAAVFNRLKKGGFTQGPLMVETVARGSLGQLVENARRARLFVEKIVG